MNNAQTRAPTEAAAPAAVLAALALTPLTGGGFTRASAARLTLAAAIEATSRARPPAVYGSQERFRASSFKKTAHKLAESVEAAPTYAAAALEASLLARGWALTSAGLLADGLSRDKLEARISLIDAIRAYRRDLKEAERNRARTDARRAAAVAAAAAVAEAVALAENAHTRAALQREQAKLTSLADAWATALEAATAARDGAAVRRLLEQEAPALATRARALGLDPEALGLA